MKSSLWSYNHVEDTWNETGVVLDLNKLCKPQLVVTDNRLFFVSGVDNHFSLHNHEGDTRWSYEISEINLEDLQHSVSNDRGGAIAQALHTPYSYSPYQHMNLHAFGFCRCIILLCKKSENIMAYELSTCSWNLLLRCPSKGLYFDKAVYLILPTSDL